MLERLSAVLLACAISAGPANADTVKVGILGPFSGAFAVFGEGWRQGIDAYQMIHGKKAGGHDIEIIYRDLKGPDPAAASALAQELIIKDKVQYLGGIVFTPNALAIAPLADEAKIPVVIFNAATSAITEKSPYLVRTSYTLWQVAVPTAQYALEQNVKKMVTIVSDYGPGLDAETAFVKTFEAGGGSIVEKIRVPLRTTDFGPFVQRIKTLAPQGLFSFFPGGPPAFGMLKAYKDNGLREAGVRFFGSSELEEKDLPSIGDVALGLETGMFYSGSHASAVNQAFKDALAKLTPRGIASPITVEGYDGLRAIYRMIEATDGKRDADKAMAAIKGFKWESPRGPVEIDAATRHIVQNIYIRRVEKDKDGQLINKEIRTYERQPDYGAKESGK